MIDTHVHFWNFDPVRDNWINDDMQIIRKDFSPENLLDVYSELNITGCVAVQASQSEEENHFLLKLAAESEIIKGIVGWVDLLAPNLDERLSFWQNHQAIKGWRHILQAENRDFILNPAFIAGVKQLKKYNYTYDLLCYHDQLEAIIQMVDQIPDQPFVLDHCGKPDAKSQDLKAWSDNIKTLAANPNVLCKVSGLLTEADWQNWTEQELFNCFDVIFEQFGPERVMYGSDWPVMLLSRPYEDWFNLVNKYTERFTVAERRMIFSDNAKRFYKIKG